MAQIPFAIDLDGRDCLLVGGGSVAARRAPILLQAGGLVRVISPLLHPDLHALVEAGAISRLARGYAAGDALGAFLVHAATGTPEVDAAVARDALASAQLVCVASEPALGNCGFMATVTRGPLMIALQTGGAAPAVTAALRRRLDAALPEHLETVLDALADLRARLREQVADPAERARRWQAVVREGALEAALDTGDRAAIDRVRRLIFP